MNPEGRADISRDAQRICETKKMNKDISMLLSSQSPLAFVFIETSQKILFLNKLLLTLSNLIMAEHLHNLQASESMIKKYSTNALFPSFWLLYNQWVFMQVCESALITSSKKLILLKQNSETNTASQLALLFTVWL